MPETSGNEYEPHENDELPVLTVRNEWTLNGCTYSRANIDPWSLESVGESIDLLVKEIEFCLELEKAIKRAEANHGRRDRGSGNG